MAKHERCAVLTDNQQLLEGSKQAASSPCLELSSCRAVPFLPCAVAGLSFGVPLLGHICS
jgi:hypothetical protein